MQVGMIGLGRMGGSMVRRLLRGGHACVVFDAQADAMTPLANQGATSSCSLTEFVKQLDPPRVVWLMVPAAVVDTTLHDLSPHLQSGDIVVDGGNSHYIDDIRRAAAFDASGVQYLDVGVSGGVWGDDRGYCLMIGDRHRSGAFSRDAGGLPRHGRAFPNDPCRAQHAGPRGHQSDLCPTAPSRAIVPPTPSSLTD